MPTLIVNTRTGRELAIEGESGLSVMEIIRNAGVDEVLALCGGACSCATCHVQVDPRQMGWLPPMKNDESELLDSSEHRTESSRLSCQIQFNEELDGLRVTFPPAETM